MAEAQSNPPGFFRLSIRPWGVFGAAGVIACVATVLGFCGRFWWTFDLFAHFRVQYFLGLAVVAVLLLIPRQRKLAACFAVFALINLAVILPISVYLLVFLFIFSRRNDCETVFDFRLPMYPGHHVPLGISRREGHVLVRHEPAQSSVPEDCGLRQVYIPSPLYHWTIAHV